MACPFSSSRVVPAYATIWVRWRRCWTIAAACTATIPAAPDDPLPRAHTTSRPWWRILMASAASWVTSAGSSRGHSFGAELGLAYALEHTPHVLALICLCGTGLQDDREWHDAYEAGQAAGLDDVPAFAYPVNMVVNREARASWKTYIKESTLLRSVADLEVPVLVLGGEHDIRPDWPLRQLAQLLPHGAFISIPGSGHCPWLSRPDDLATELRSFIDNQLHFPQHGR